MAEYHLYFLDGRGAIEARHDFRANEDAEAITLAGIVSEAVSDTHAGYELWNHAHCLVSTRNNIGSPYQHSDVNALYTLRQRNILDVEETLLQSHWRVAQSQKLLEATRDLRGHWTAAHPYLEKTVRLACEIADAHAASLFLVAGSVLRPYIVYNLPQEYIAGIAEVRIGTQCCGRAVASKSLGSLPICSKIHCSLMAAMERLTRSYAPRSRCLCLTETT